MFLAFYKRYACCVPGICVMLRSISPVCRCYALNGPHRSAARHVYVRPLWTRTFRIYCWCSVICIHDEVCVACCATQNSNVRIIRYINTHTHTNIHTITRHKYASRAFLNPTHTQTRTGAESADTESLYTLTLLKVHIICSLMCSRCTLSMYVYVYCPMYLSVSHTSWEFVWFSASSCTLLLRTAHNKHSQRCQ